MHLQHPSAIDINTQPLPLTQAHLCEDLIAPSPLLLSVLDHPMVLNTDCDMEGSVPIIPMGKSLSQEEPSLTQDLFSTSKTAMTSSSEPLNTINNTEDPQQCLLDFVEWWCHKLITAESAEEVEAAETELLKAMENFGRDAPEFGRLANRIQMAALSLDVALLSARKSSLTVQEHWGFLKEELILWKSKLLRQDANADVVLLPAQERLAFKKATPDFKREQSPLFQKTYQTVLRLVQVQYNLAVFQSKLTELVSGIESDKNGSSSSTSQENKRLVREAIEEYEQAVNKLFTPTTINSDDMSTTSAASNVTQLPQELAGFLLKDLYQTSKGGSSSPTSSPSSEHSLAGRLLRHVESIVQGNGTYAQSACQRHLRQLLQDWHQLVLDAPTLVQLGYGLGTGEPSARKAIAEEDAMLRRLSNCEGAQADIGEALLAMPDDISDIEDNEPSNEPIDSSKKRSFVPIQWVDTDSDDEEALLPPPEPSKKRAKTKKQKINKSLTLYSDSEEDPMEATVSPTKSYSNSSRKRSRSGDASSRTTASTTAEPRVRVSPAEAEAIKEGVHKFGVGRWTILQQQANGLLDKLSPQKIKVAYQQLKSKGKL